MPAEGYINNAELERAILDGDRETLGAALLILAGRVVGTWGQHMPAGVDVEDVEQDAVIATLRRLEGWDPKKGRAFAYATESMKYTIREYRRSGGRWAVRHRPLAAARIE